MPKMTVEDLRQEANSNASKILGQKMGSLIFRPGQTRGQPRKVGRDYYRNYAKKVREKAVRDAMEHMLRPPSATDTASLNDEFQNIADRWLVGARAHDEWGTGHLFRDKPRGYGQSDGSTDGRLLRKLIMATAQEAATTHPSFDSYRNEINAANDNLKEAERELQRKGRTPNALDKYKKAQEKLFLKNNLMNEEIASKLGNLFSQAGENPSLKKAIFLTQEKLRDPLGYKQKYARVVPFNDPANPDKWVKASRRFYTPANVPLPLPDRSDGEPRDTSVVKMHPPSGDLPNFGPDKQDLIEDVGQRDLGECWLQASAASLPRSTLGNMFSWRPSYGSEGVTTRLHDENGNPMYIRTQKNQLWNDASDHKALWPAALAAAAAKVGRDELRQFRGTKPRDDKTGMPLYSVRDVYGNTAAAASKLLTGKAPLMSENVSGLSDEDKITRIGNLWARARNAGAERGVATFGNFDNAHGNDDGPGHLVTWLNTSSDGTLGTFGNPWMVASGIGTGAVSRGHKIFDADTSRMRYVTFLPQEGADPAKDMFVQNGPSNIRQRRLLGNFMP
jgi:hypothetical protein